jgi:GTP cyclohydrolase I
MAYFKKEGFDQEPTEKLLANYQNIIGLLGEDPNREGLQKTPERMAKAMQFMTQGYQQNAVDLLNYTPCANTICFLFLVRHISLIYPMATSQD